MLLFICIVTNTSAKTSNTQKSNCPNTTFYENINKHLAVAEMSNRGHNTHIGQKEGEGLLCQFRRDLGPCLIQCVLDRDLLPQKVASSSIQLFDHNTHEPKLGAVPLLLRRCNPI